MTTIINQSNLNAPAPVNATSDGRRTDRPTSHDASNEAAFRRLMDRDNDSSRSDKTEQRSKSQSDPGDLETRHKEFNDDAADLSASNGQVFQLHTFAAQIDTAVPVANGVPAAADLAQLIDRYAQQLLVGGQGVSLPGESRFIIRLAEQVLPGTTLTLTKIPEGWALQANTSSYDAYRMLNESKRALEARFAARKLGDIHVEAIFHEGNASEYDALA